MGLLLSVLLVCVGVAELLKFCNTVHSRANSRNSALKPQQVPRIRLSNCLSHEDIEIEVKKNALQSRSRSSSPRRFLVTEKDAVLDERSRSSSPRRFVAAEEPQGLQRSPYQKSIPEFLFTEQVLDVASGSAKRIVLKEEDAGIVPPLPLPKQFVVTEQVLAHIRANSTIREPIEIHENFYQAEKDVRLFETTSERTQQLLEAERLSPARARSPSPCTRKYDSFRRSPSPFPSFELLAPRNSICTELLDNPPVSVKEVDEDDYPGSQSPSPTNRLRQKSPSFDLHSVEEPIESFRSRSKSESMHCLTAAGTTLRKTISQFHLSAALDAGVSNNSDGVKPKKKAKQRRRSQHALDKPGHSRDLDLEQSPDGRESNSKAKPQAFWVI